MWCEVRTADKTGAVSLFGNHYEIDAALARSKVELVFDPFDLSDIEVRYQGRPMGKAIPRRIHRHTHPRARPETAPVPKPSGIDYLGLVSARVAAEQATRIAYAQLNPEPTDAGDGDGDGDGGSNDDNENSDDKEIER